MIMIRPFLPAMNAGPPSDETPARLHYDSRKMRVAGERIGYLLQTSTANSTGR